MRRLLQRLTDAAPVALLVLAVCSPAAAAPDADATRPIKAAVSADYYPMIYPAEKGRMQGTDVEYLVALAKQLKRKIEFVPVTFADLLPGVAAYKYDIGVAAMDVVPPSENIEYVEYFTLPDALVVKESSALKAGPKLDLTKAVVGSETVAAARGFYAKEVAAGRVLKSRGFEGEPALLDALERGYVDAVVMRLPAAIERTKKSGGKLRILAHGMSRQPLGIAVPKTSTGLVKLIREGVLGLRQDGTTAKLEAKAEELMLEQLKAK